MKTDLDNWKDAFTHACSKTGEKWRAWAHAHAWAVLNELKTLPRTSPPTNVIIQLHPTEWTAVSPETAATITEMLLQLVEGEIQKTLQSCNGDYFRWFAETLEKKGRPHCDVRLWFVLKHAPHKGKIPKFTSTQLLEDAGKNKITISSARQLTRLMAEFKPFGFAFKNSHVGCR